MDRSFTGHLAFLLLTLFVSTALSCGGEGPSPLLELSDVKTTIHQLPTQGEIEEFVRWERKDKIIFRNSDQQLFQTSVTGLEPLIEMAWPLSRVTDHAERYVLSQDHNQVLDVEASDKKWLEFAAIKQPQHLFWAHGRLYSMEIEYGEGRPKIQIYESMPGSGSARYVCGALGEKGVTYYQMDGQRYPHASLYTVKKRGGRYHYRETHVNVTHCVAWFHSIDNGFVAPITRAALMHSPEATYLELDHPTHRMAWWATGYPCRYYNAFGATPMVLNTKYPLVATWSETAGLHLINLATAERRPILNGVPISALDPSHIWLDSNRRTLYLAPRLRGEATRSMLKASLN